DLRGEGVRCAGPDAPDEPLRAQGRPRRRQARGPALRVRRRRQEPPRRHLPGVLRHPVQTLPAPLRPTAERLFGERLDLAERFVSLLAEQGPERGLIGPREVERLWERHLLNCAFMADAIDDAAPGARTLADVG